MGEVGHAKGTPEDRAEGMVEAFRPAVAGTTDEVVGDLVQPVGQRLAERIPAYAYDGLDRQTLITDPLGHTTPGRTHHRSPRFLPGT